MRKQLINAVSLLVIAAFLLMTSACQNSSVSENKNAGNTNSIVPVSNANANSADAVKPVANENANTVGKVSEENSASEKKSDEKLAQRIIGLWEGKNPAGRKIGLDFRTDNKVYPVGSDKEEKPAQYRVIDEENAELTTPDAKAEIFKIKVEGDKMIVSADTGKIELTKVK